VVVVVAAALAVAVTMALAIAIIVCNTCTVAVSNKSDSFDGMITVREPRVLAYELHFILLIDYEHHHYHHLPFKY
jgi:hypothetical protein